MTNFRVGQKVVCIDASRGRDGYMSPLEEKAIYTIVEITDGYSYRGEDKGLLFKEIPPMLVFPKGYSHSRFRPLVTRKTDISVFKAMLNTQRTGVPA